MYRSLAAVAALLSASSLACGRSPTNPAARELRFNTALADAESQTPITVVEVKSENLTAHLPDGAVRTLILKAHVEGADPSSLAGEARHFGIAGAHNRWTAVGTTDGTSATLSGTVSESTGAGLVGSPVQIVGDAATGIVSLTFGPLAGGPRAGQTLLFTGTGRVTIDQRD